MSADAVAAVLMLASSGCAAAAWRSFLRPGQQWLGYTVTLLAATTVVETVATLTVWWSRYPHNTAVTLACGLSLTVTALVLAEVRAWRKWVLS